MTQSVDKFSLKPWIYTRYEITPKILASKLPPSLPTFISGDLWYKILVTKDTRLETIL